MFHQIQSRLQEEVSSHMQARYGLDIPVVLEEPADPKFGELALTAAFQLAKQLKKAPRAIAQELVADLGSLPGVRAMEIAGAGYINIRLDRGAYAASLLTPPAAPPAAAGKIIVEHTNINPNKAAHIGHLRNAILGDTFVRMLRASGRAVEVQNYIDNTGVQVADVIAGFRHLEGKNSAEVAALARSERFDYVCWDVYARVSQHFKENPADEKSWRHEALHAIEAGHGELADLGHLVADAIVLCHLRTMRRLGIVYDVLPRESEILHLKFWATAFEQLRERNAIHLESSGPKEGCWVMAGAHYSEDAAEDDSKVIVRSNGIVTYVGKDIAYQMWKFGVLGKDFHYRRLLTESDGHEVWVSTDQEQPAGAPHFGGGATVYNVIDSRQSYLQDVVAAGLRALGYPAQAEQSIHFAYEMVALTPRTCVELGIELSEEDKSKAQVQVSGRKGLGVKADDLIDKLIEKAFGEVSSRSNVPAEDQRKVAEQIAVGALRYFMLKFTRNTVIAFDLSEALAFTGETGPYVQYAAVRSRKILQKLADQGDRLDTARLTPALLARQLEFEDFWQLLTRISKVDAAIAKAVTAGEPAHVARYAFQLAQAFSAFYDKYSVKDEPDPERKAFLIWMTGYFREQLERVAGILGIPVPEYM